MAVDPRKRQKKLERKTAKRKAHRRTIFQRSSSEERLRFQNAATAPLLQSFGAETLWETGIGYVLLSREFRPGQVAFSIFLLDMYCLGVKDAMWGMESKGYVDALAGKLWRGQIRIKMEPECARKLVEGAVAYARDLGFSPHVDYECAKLILGDIDSRACAESFVYGRDGKPMFVAGPYDSPERCRQIISTLNARLGPEGHHYVVPASDDDFPQDFAETDDEDDEVEDEDEE
jgi:hypothetical protein